MWFNTVIVTKDTLEKMSKWLEKADKWKKIFPLFEEKVFERNVLTEDNVHVAKMRVLDTMKDSNSILLFFPWIVPDTHYSAWDAFKGVDGSIKWFQSYWWRSPFTETISSYVWNWEQARVIKFDYFNQKEIDKPFSEELILSYLKENVENLKWKKVSIYGQSMWWAVAIEIAWFLIENEIDIEHIIMYAPSIWTNTLIPPTNKLNLIKNNVILANLAAFFQHKIALRVVAQQIRNAIKKWDWWIELSQKDMDYLAKWVKAPHILQKAIKDRLLYLARFYPWVKWKDWVETLWKLLDEDKKRLEKMNQYIESIRKKSPKIDVILSDIWNWTDWAIVNAEVMISLEDYFPNQDINILLLQWLPHVNVPQAAWLHKRVLDKYLLKRTWDTIEIK